MHASKLIKVLKTFTTNDWKALAKLIASPVYSAPADVQKLTRLLALIRAAQPGFSAKKLSKSRISSLVFPDHKGNANGQLSKLMSKLLKLIETYLLREQKSQTETMRLMTLARCWRERGLDTLEQSCLEKAERLLKHTEGREKEYYEHHMTLSEEWMGYYSAKSPIKVGFYLQQTEQHLDEWYLLSKLEQAVWQKAQQIQTKSVEQVTLLPLPELLSKLKVADLEPYPVHLVYYYALNFLHAYQEADIRAFQLVESQLEKHGHLLEPGKLKALQTLLRIFATGRYNAGKQTYLDVSLRLYQSHLKAGYLYFDDKIHSQSLLNMVTLGLRSSAYQWVEELIEAHKDRILDQNNAAQAYRFNRAMCLFYQQQGEAALDYLDDSYDNLYYGLAARRLEIMIYYKASSLLLEPKIEAFKVYIHRQSQKQIPAKPKALNNNFINLLRQIIHPSTLVKKKRIQRLQQKLNDTEYLAEREWLATVLQELLE